MKRWLNDTKKLLALSLVGLSCGPTSSIEGANYAETTSALTVEDKLKTLRALQADERATSRSLQISVDARLQVFLDQATKKNVLLTLERNQPSS